MENILYNILWIDDQHETLTATKGRAKRNGINLIPFKSLNSGMDELERNYSFYDGVLLDAKFLENDNDIAGTEDTDYVHRAKERLLQLKKKFEIFVFTAQAEAFDSKDFNKAFKRVYNKGTDEHVERLFSDIKLAAALQEDTQIRHNYKRVFNVCTEKYIGNIAGKDLLTLLKENDSQDFENRFNTIRKVVEDLFRAFNKYKLLPDEFVSGSVSLNESSKFLTGKNSDGVHYIEKGYKHLDETHLPKPIAQYLRNILPIVQAGSHRSEMDLYVKTIQTPYLYKSVVFQLLDIIVWFKMHIDSEPKRENWEKSINTNGYLSGKVINKDESKGFAFLQPNNGSSNIYIHANLVRDHALENGQSIEVELEEFTDSKTNELRQRVKQIR